MAPHLTAEWIRACFAAGTRTAAVLEDGAPQAELRPAAVLIPVVTHAAGLTVLLTQRTDHLHDHAGQIAFPGGRRDEGDDSPVATALREAAEEIGLAATQVEVLGRLPEYRTGTGFVVTPVVGLVTPPLALRPDPFEVADVFETPLAFLLDPANHQRHSAQVRGQLRHYWAMPFEGHFIWGATAGMIRSLCQLLDPRERSSELMS